jgi:ParB family transcriptional regulator, chromosome partitioning protein
MTKTAAPKLSLASPVTIPLDKLEIHAANVRKSQIDDAGIQDLAADIALRGLLQSLSVRPVLDADHQETGAYTVQAGGRRFRALKLLVKQKKLAKNAPIPCIVKTDGFAEADSLAENTQRQALTPLDEFRAFKAMAENGHGEDTIAAAFRVSVLVVRQRLRLANASPVILKAFEDGEMTLEQLMAYCVTDNHARQEQVFDVLGTGHAWNNRPDQIRRMLTEKSVATDDKRVLFIGADTYLAAGGAIERNLFSEEGEGYLLDVALVERLVSEKLAAEAERIKTQGWDWTEHAAEFPWNHRRDYRAINPVAPALTEEEEEEHSGLSDELEEIQNSVDDLNELDAKTRKRMTAIEARLEELNAKQPVYADEQKAKAGVFVSIADDGSLHIEPGFRRQADVIAEAQTRAAGVPAGTGEFDGEYQDEPDRETAGETGALDALAPNDDDSADLPDKLMTELTAYHSLGLRNALAADHAIAYLAVLHALTLKLFYRGHTTDSCLQIAAYDTLVPPFAGLAEFKAASEIAARHEAFEKMLPERETALWDYLLGLDESGRQLLFAHCAGLSVNAVHEPAARGSNKRRHAGQLAEALRLDMGAQGFVTTAANYLGRIKKQQILETVAEAKDEETAGLLADLKKRDMAAEAERLLDGTGWLPEALRTAVVAGEGGGETSPLPAFLDEDDATLQAAE